MPKMKTNVKNRKGVATIIGSILSIVILLFFFSNVFLWYTGVSQEMNLVMADKLNAQINLATTVLEGTLHNCTDDPKFGGIEDRQLGEYGVIHEPSYLDTRETDGNYQILREESHYASQFYIALNATYSFTVDVQAVPKSRALTFSFYGWYDDEPDEACRVYLWNYDLEIYEYTGITITSIESWYNATFLNPNRFVSSSGAVNVTYLSTHNLYDQSVFPELKGLLYIDAHHVAISPVGLTVQALGGRDIQVLRLWVINETANEHHYLDFNDVFGLDIWIPGGSSINIEFGDMNQIVDGNIMLDYSPILGEVRFRILTNLGNTAMTKYE